MYRCITLRSYAIRGSAQSIQQPHAHSHTRTITTVGPRLSAGPTGPTIDKAEGVAGLVAAATLWYYYANAESAHANKEREGPRLGKSAEGGHERTVSDATRTAKERSQDVFKSGDAKYQEVKTEAEAKVGATKDQIGQTFERGKRQALGHCGTLWRLFYVVYSVSVFTRLCAPSQLNAFLGPMTRSKRPFCPHLRRNKGKKTRSNDYTPDTSAQ
ncbi:hypothetical protein F5148DRAFT_1148875 [Russula earlei]|uniref:Uncharacterized protein n=1 Tax=Russula earlei TaxID=71964 RepID=A0ACC0UCX2_9AGAM|nr:hypothetical protein F5148DRAFT_1148875 [Russula earlei]